MSLESMRRAGNRVLGVLMRRNPRNCLKNPTVPMPRVNALSDREKADRTRNVLCCRGWGRDVRTGQNGRNVTILAECHPRDTFSENVLILNRPFPAMTKLAMIDWEQR